MEQLIQLIYVSSAENSFSEQELNDLLKAAREANQKNNITGLLLHKDGNFMQVIEGEKSAIKQLFTNIFRDERHARVTLVLKEDIEQREFADWSMGFKNVSTDEVEGFSDFLSSSTATELMAGKAKAVLLSFKYG